MHRYASSLSTNPEYQVNWWCGVPMLLKKNEKDEGVVQRLGLATRYGYIVISPVWCFKGQLQYNYSEVEHAKVLKCYRDALRHFSVDTDGSSSRGIMRGRRSLGILPCRTRTCGLGQ